MKIVVINGSPKGKDSNTNVMVDALLKGARVSGAETVNIFLSEKQIEHCKGCHTCWKLGPGQCVISDDMLEILSHMGGADIIAFASPVYFENISGMLKVFMDRMTMIGGPSAQPKPDPVENTASKEATKVKAPKLLMISSCGHPDNSEFDVTSLWINRIAEKMHMALVGEIYATRGRMLTEATEEVKNNVDKYLALIESAGVSLAKEGELSENLKKQLRSGFIM